MVFGLEVECARRADALELAAIFLSQPDGCVGVGEVGDVLEPLVDLGLESPQPFFFVGHVGFEPFALVDERRAFFGVALAARGLGNLILPAANLFDSLEQPATLAFQSDHAVDVVEHVGRYVAVAAILLDRFGVRDDVFEVEHVGSFLAWIRLTALPAPRAGARLT